MADSPRPRTVSVKSFSSGLFLRDLSNCAQTAVVLPNSFIRARLRSFTLKKIRMTALALAVLVLFATAAAGPSGAIVPINLGTATNFGLLAGSGVTNSSAATSITGDVGSSPNPAVTGLIATQVHGTLFTAASPITAQAQADLKIGYNAAAGAACGTDLTGTDLGGLTLVPGVYCFSSSALLTGTLTLDGQGNANAEWIFQIGSTLTTATNATVLLINHAANCNVFWQIGSSAIIQTNNTFVGNILALTSITLDGGTLNGRALARNGAVTISGQETVVATPCTCNVIVSSSSAGTVTNISVPMPEVRGRSSKTIIASGLTSAEALSCGPDGRIYLAQSGVFGGPRRIIRMDQNGQNKTVILDFSKVTELAGSGGPAGLTFTPQSAAQLYFGTTLAQGMSNTGVWNESSLVQSILPFPSQGSANGAGATAFLKSGPFKGNLLAVDIANSKVVRVPPPFSLGQAGIDFITTNLTSPVGLAINILGNIFVSNTDGTIQQFASDGTSLGLYANTGLHNMNISFDPTGHVLAVATQDGPVIQILPNGIQESLGTVVGGDGIAICKH